MKKTVVEWKKDKFLISTERSLINVEYVHEYLATKSYWAQDIPYAVVQKSISGSCVSGSMPMESKLDLQEL